ncbi:hypothetical protein O3P69_000276 [Scylla paramamosain]|uniref:Ionotropic glutamate receptor L-glutamate and glycine-binding domain-containing protein n=1 Tax=Scylla paramamosain TaxID=85552 RepID=A0AAW0UY05_SCYPA
MATHSRPVLKVAVEEWVPWTKVLTDADRTMKVEGPMGKLLDMISSVLNLDYEFVRADNAAWGRSYPNGSWDGMLGQVQRREVEFAVGPFGVTHQRESVCDFTDPMYSENNAILMVRPTLQNDMAGFVKPFSGKTHIPKRRIRLQRKCIGSFRRPSFLQAMASLRSPEQVGGTTCHYQKHVPPQEERPQAMSSSVLATELKEEDDRDLLGCRLPFLTREEINSLYARFCFDCSSCGSVRWIMHEGADVVVMEFCNCDVLVLLLPEACFMQECSVDGLLTSVAYTFCRSGEEHDDTAVTFTGSVYEPTFHFIALDWSCLDGRAARDFTFEIDEGTCGAGTSDESQGITDCLWMAQE